MKKAMKSTWACTSLDSRRPPSKNRRGFWTPPIYGDHPFIMEPGGPGCRCSAADPLQLERRRPSLATSASSSKKNMCGGAITRLRYANAAWAAAEHQTPLARPETELELLGLVRRAAT